MKDQQQYILARDMIDMIRDYKNDAQALEYIDSFSFALARMFDGENAVQWHEISSVCDQAWYAMKQGEIVSIDMKKLDAIYSLCEKKIEEHASGPKARDDRHELR